MLRQILITNYALIDRVEIEFDSGFTAITGETGSGKSILIDALGLILGDRANLKSIRKTDQKCIVEGVFSAIHLNLKGFFEKNDLDYDEHVTLRREIAPGGKSRNFINDTPVALNTLRELGMKLVDIHSQHENSILGDRSFQFSVVDSFAGNNVLLATYTAKYLQWISACNELDTLIAQENKLRQDLDYFRFQFDELSKIQLEKISPKELEEELDVLSNAELIKSSLDQLILLLDNPEEGVLSRIAQGRAILSKVSTYQEKLDQLHHRLESSRLEIADILDEVNSLSEKIIPDEKRINQVNELLAVLNNLKKKHALNEVSQLLSLRESLREKIDTAENFNERIVQLRNAVLLAETEMERISQRITEGRKEAAKQVEKETSGFFRKLGLTHARFEMTISPSKEFNSNGKDDIQLLFSANKGSMLQPVQSVASGGEISRVMLALKAAISQYRELPTLILDEIDQGISGQTALQTGSLMKEMSAKLQVISITHLPQIAGKADHQFKVYKTSGKNETLTHIRKLEMNERVNELAEMLSGKDISGAALENAKELLRV